MKKFQKYLVILFLLFVNLFVSAQSGIFKNLDFEEGCNENGMPLMWYSSKGSEKYSISIDKENKFEGEQSLKIECKEKNSNFVAIMQKIPAIYEGKTITVSAMIKLENVENAIGLMLRIDDENQSLEFDNMQKKGIKGTIDWEQYSINLPLSKRAKHIVIGILLVGKGIVWADNISVLIDEKDYTLANLKKESEIPADNDNKEFKDSSKINITELNEFQINNLDLLGKMWGFLKYYHPAIAEGKYNWDFELFRIMPKILDVTNNYVRDSILTIWIENLGEITKTESLYVNDSAIFKPDFRWIDTINFSANFVQELINIKNAKRKEKNYYVELSPNVKNPIFKNENSYKSMIYPDAGYRLLSLFRYWNMINYFFPYKNVIDEDWNEVLKEFIPKFCTAKDENEYVLTALELITKINDTHANIYGNEILNKIKGNNVAQIEVSFVENKLVVTNKLEEDVSNVKIGDVITKINNKKVEEIVENNLTITPASNYETKLRNIASDILRTNDTIINIEYYRNNAINKGNVKTISVMEFNNNKYVLNKDTCFSIINKKIAYLYPGTIKNNYLPQLWKKIVKTKGLVIDLRCYPSDYIVYSLSAYLLPENTQFVKFLKPSVMQPGFFNYSPIVTTGFKKANYYKGKVAILVNEQTQSQAEFTAMALQIAPNAKIFGSTTAGADGNVSAIYLPGGIFTYISGIGIYYPDGRETQRVGIIPDVEVKPTIKGIQNGIDEVLEKAKQWIKGNK